MVGDAVTAVEGAGGPNDKKADGKTGEEAGVEVGVFLGVAHCSMHPHERDHRKQMSTALPI